ncbi:hypothetical protein JMG10_13325 [Nostoc ellipsosporum NOK]|nr:hypothetical protein [Nostoc ellipsosporum NOK]
MTTLWIAAGLFGVLTIVTSILSGVRDHNAKHSLSDEHAEWLGIGCAFNFHEREKY